MIQSLDDIKEVIFQTEDFGGFGIGTALNHVFLCRLSGKPYAVFLAELYGLNGGGESYRYALCDAEKGVCIPHGTPEYSALTADFPKTDALSYEGAVPDPVRMFTLLEVPDRLAEPFCKNGTFDAAQRAEYDAYLREMRALASPSMRVLYDYFSGK